MIQFKPYPSIGNAADAAWMAQVREHVEIGTLFAVQEKVAILRAYLSHL